MATKEKCAVCKTEIVLYKEVLMMGANGFRRYKCCAKCAEKIETDRKEYQKHLKRATKQIRSGIAS